MKRILILTLVLLSLSLSACGRMNAPVAPKDSVYPRTYY